MEMAFCFVFFLPKKHLEECLDFSLYPGVSGMPLNTPDETPYAPYAHSLTCPHQVPHPHPP